MSSAGQLVVAAFDFGTTYSGYAYSFLNDPLKVITNQNWVAGSEKLVSLKTSTTILLTPDQTFDSFGYIAENKYTQLVEDEEHQKWRFFRRFKMLLHNNKKLNEQATVDDIEGKSIRAMTLFALSIRYLQQHMLKSLETRATGIEETDIQYVITVPAIWDDRAKQFMRQAAIEAGFDTNRLKLALEPEAASLWCQITSDTQLALAGTGTCYMIIDIGGGTADIAVHKKQAKGKLKEISRASGGPWGGRYVDKRYMGTLENVFDRRALENLKREDIGDYFDILREFEVKKRAYDDESSNKMMIKYSVALKEISEKVTHRDLDQNLSRSRYAGKIEMKGRDKLRIDPDFVKEWFDGPIDALIDHVQRLLRDPALAKVQNIVLVGGFAESIYVQERMKKELKGKTILVPPEAGLVVAVRFGHDCGAVETRIMPYTYGIGKYSRYDSSVHQPEKMEIIDGKESVRHAFKVFVKVNESVKAGRELTNRFIFGKEVQKSHIPVFRTTKPNPIFTTEPECEKLGTLHIERPEGGSDRSIYTTFIFGDTELKVKVRVGATGKEHYLTINCL